MVTTPNDMNVDMGCPSLLSFHESMVTVSEREITSRRIVPYLNWPFGARWSVIYHIELSASQATLTNRNERQRDVLDMDRIIPPVGSKASTQVIALIAIHHI